MENVIVQSSDAEVVQQAHEPTQNENSNDGEAHQKNNNEEAKHKNDDRAQHEHKFQFSGTDYIGTFKCDTCHKQDNLVNRGAFKCSSCGFHECVDCFKGHQKVFDNLDTEEPENLIRAQDLYKLLRRAGYKEKYQSFEEFRKILESLKLRHCVSALCGHYLDDPEDRTQICFRLFKAFTRHQDIDICLLLMAQTGGQNWVIYQINGYGADFIPGIQPDGMTTFSMSPQSNINMILKAFGQANNPPINTISVKNNIVFFTRSTEIVTDQESYILKWQNGQYVQIDNMKATGSPIIIFSVVDRDLIELLANNTNSPQKVDSYVIRASSTTMFWSELPTSNNTMSDINCYMRYLG